MQRWATTLVGVLAVALAIWLVARNYNPPTPIGHDPNIRAGDGGSDEARTPMFALADAGTASTGEDAAPLLLSDLVRPEPEARLDSGPGSALLDGRPVPMLPLDAPREVRFGVVFVSYAGAQPSVAGGKPATRSRADAQALASKLLATAQQDFHAAVQQGDAGSSDDVGRVRRGVLEPAPEYVLFTLPAGAIGGPVDTPRGYWIVKRLE